MVTNPADIEEKEQAMDFFHGLDQGRNGIFKTNMLNSSWVAGAFDPLDMVNKTYRMVGSWVKPVPQDEGGTAVSYATIEEGVKQAAAKKKQEQNRK
jgi:tRNA(Ile2) C34 agmatinyltransferase TiaS